MKSVIHFACICVVGLVITGCCATKLQGFRKVDIGGCRLNMLVVGHGSPVVVLDSGLGDTTTSWEMVQPQVAEFTTVIAFDRAGLGLSDAAPSAPRTSAQMARELHTALHAAGIKPPYVLVGHSAGGFNARLFAYQFPKEVEGMVLVDPSSEDWDDIMRTQFPAKYQEVLDWRAQPHPEGLKRQMEGNEASKGQVRAAWPLPDVPVVVLVGMKGKPDGSETKYFDEWYKVHEEWLRKIPHGTLVVARKSGHYIQFDEPKLVVNAISNMVTTVRGHTLKQVVANGGD
ncbi:MAG TPA: alpha/beta hydrolase [Verrucomicrobiae bacterium]|nr:alpha/beta hydrolase [Verrucomicrobiae bacterium]